MENKEELKKPHWIHDTADDPTSVTGKRYLVTCTCSECGYHANMEKPVCPQCKAKMKSLQRIPARNVQVSFVSNLIQVTVQYHHY